MLELQSLQKEKRREQLFKLQKNDTSPVDILVSISKKTSFLTNHVPTNVIKTDLDSFSNDTCLDDSTTVADDIIILNAEDSGKGSTLRHSHRDHVTVSIQFS